VDQRQWEHRQSLYDIHLIVDYFPVLTAWPSESKFRFINNLRIHCLSSRFSLSLFLTLCLWLSVSFALSVSLYNYNRVVNSMVGVITMMMMMMILDALCKLEQDIGYAISLPSFTVLIYNCLCPHLVTKTSISWGKLSQQEMQTKQSTCMQGRWAGLTIVPWHGPPPRGPPAASS